MQKPYFRDIWALGPSSNGYPGAFPRGLITRIKKKWWGNNRLWLFSGSFKDSRNGITLDINKELNPDICGNCEVIPFKNNSFDFVMADPPYSEKESHELYNLPYVNIIKTLNEMIRVCKPGGNVLFLHRLVPAIFPGLNLSKKTQLIGVVGVFTIAGLSNIRALTIFKKRGELKQEYFMEK
jgi:SAM-dependent methyltransferase